MKQPFLHIGYPKTGTTSVRRFCAQSVKTVFNPPWSDNIEGFILYHTGIGAVSYADFLNAVGASDHPASVRRTAVDAALKVHMVGDLITVDARAATRQRFLSPAMREALVRRYEPVYRNVARDFLGGENNALFTERMPAASDPWEGRTEWSIEEMAETIVGAVAWRLLRP